MSFDMNNLNPVTRFFWEDGDKEWVDLRLASDSDTEKLRKKAGIKMKTEYRRDARRGQLQRLEYLDADEEKLGKFAELLNDHVISDWCLLTKEGEKIPCTTENKIKLLRGSPKFSEWIADCLEKLRLDTKTQEDKERKNSENTLSD